MIKLLPYGCVAACLIVVNAVAVEANENEKKARTIPLSTIVTTSPQAGLQPIHEVFEKKGNAQGAEEFLQKNCRSRNGSSNVFMVDADTILDALSASARILVGSRSADTSAQKDGPSVSSESHWIVVYFGIGPSDPTWWTLENVAVENRKVLVRYRHAKKGQPVTKDLHPYYFWIPIGKLDSGVYELSLVDAEKGEAILQRRVAIALNERK